MGGGSYMDGVGRAIRDDGGGAWSRAGAMDSVLAKRCKACYVLCAMEPLPLGLMSIRPPILPLLPPFGMKPAGPSAGVGGAAGDLVRRAAGAAPDRGPPLPEGDPDPCSTVGPRATRTGRSRSST